MLRLRLFLAIPCTLAVLALCGCNLSQFSQVSQAPSALPSLSGTVHGGQQPVSGALIQLYAANTTVLQGAATPLIAKPVYTDRYGNFSITGGYICPSAATLVYIVASGGNPGLAGTVNNTNIALMTVLGTCGALNASTTLIINELTTVAAVEALTPFMLDFAHVGVELINITSLTTAFNTAVEFVSPWTGQFWPSFAPGVVAPIALMNTLADILAVCVNTVGGLPNDGSICGKLFYYTSSSVDIILVLLSIIHNPTINVTVIFNLIAPYSPFQPILLTAPVSFALPIGYVLDLTYTHLYDQLLSDSQGHIWLLQPYVGTVTQYDSNLNVLHTINVGSFLAGGTALHMTLDPYDNLWVPYGAAILKINSSGTVVSPPTGYPIPTFGIGGYVGQSFTSDSSGNIWGITYRTSDLAICLVEASNNGTILSPSSGYCGPQTLNNATSPTNVIADSAGNLYVTFFGTGSSPIEKFNSSGYVSSLTTNNYYGVGGYYSAIFDPKYQHLWASDSIVLDNLSLSGTVNFSSYGSTATSALYTPYSNGLAVDGGGNLWLASELGALTEVGPTGTVLSRCVSTTLCGIPVFGLSTGYLAGIAIDPAGDVFTIDASNGALLKFPGIAAAK